jgi:hypothetical protein
LALGTRGDFDRAGVGRGLHALFQKPRLQISHELQGPLLKVVECGKGLGCICWKEAIEDGIDVLVQLTADVIAV